MKRKSGKCWPWNHSWFSNIYAFGSQTMCNNCLMVLETHGMTPEDSDAMWEKFRELGRRDNASGT